MSFVNIHGYDEAARQWRNVKINDSGELLMSESTTPIGSYGNLHSGNLTPMSGTSELDVSVYKDSVISYSDLSPTNVGAISLYGSTTSPAVNWHYLGKIVPIAAAAGVKREGVAVVKLAPFKKIYAYNESTTETQLSAVLSVVSN
jgi:hypothetical protein